jgi:hypothetical protein
MVFEVQKHSFSRQSRMEVKACADEREPWWREIDYPDPKSALFFGWQKAGFDVPDFEPAANPVSKVDRFKRPECMANSGIK